MTAWTPLNNKAILHFTFNSNQIRTEHVDTCNEPTTEHAAVVGGKYLLYVGGIKSLELSVDDVTTIPVHVIDGCRLYPRQP